MTFGKLSLLLFVLQTNVLFAADAAPSDANKFEIERTANPIAVLETTQTSEVPDQVRTTEAGEPKTDAALTITILGDTGLPRAVLSAAADDIRRFRAFGTTFVLRGLPVIRSGAGARTDKAEAQKRLLPFLNARVPVSVDPRLFREASDKAQARIGRPLMLPAVLLKTRSGTVMMEGTVSPAAAIREALRVSKSDAWREDVLKAIDDAELTDVLYPHGVP